MQTRAEPGEPVRIYGTQAFDRMRVAGAATAQALDRVAAHVAPGVSTDALNDIVIGYARENGYVPAPLYYRGFPKAICTSVNHVVCHGIPGPRALSDGDIVNVDVTLVVDGWHGDASRMFAVGSISRRAERLLEVTAQCLQLGVDAVKPGATTGDIGHAIQRYAEAQRFSVVRDFCGHGIGRSFHEAPRILHYGMPGQGERLRPGMMFTIEPMINCGRPHVKILQDGWTAVTRDRSLSAQIEHTVGVTPTGVAVFTEASG